MKTAFYVNHLKQSSTADVLLITNSMLLLGKHVSHAKVTNNASHRPTMHVKFGMILTYNQVFKVKC